MIEHAGDPSRPQIQTLLASDLVESTRLVESLGDSEAAALFAQHDRMARGLLVPYRGQEIDKSDGFLLLFERPIEAALYSLTYHTALKELGAEHGVELRARVGIHLGEVILRENDAEEVARGAKPIEVEGLAKPTAFRVSALALAGQTLLTRPAFAMARHSEVEEGMDARVVWIAHGRFLVKGIEDPVAVFEAAILGQSPMATPLDSEKAQRVAEDGTILGWRPGLGLEIPRRENWILEAKLGEGGFGEAWLARHKKTREGRVFKFCFDGVALRTLQHETTLFRLLKETLGQREDIARILDWNFESAPYFIESEYTQGGNLVDWAESQGGLAEVPLATRIELVVQIAEALGAAHSVGVLHKDVKPQNVLVSLANGVPHVRLTDFGIGRILDRELLEEAGITQLDVPEGLTEISSSSGTMMYMSPERVEGREATVHADIYGVGVTLYQMVVGDFARTLAQGWEREVADELLREDIAAAVDGSPERRLGSASLLAERLRSLEERRREGEREAERMAEAERASASLVTSRRRRRALVGALFMLTAFTSVVAYQARLARAEAARANVEALRATAEADRANREMVTAEQVTEFLVDLFVGVDPEEARGQAVTAREILDRGAEKIRDGTLDEDPLVQARLGHVVGRVYYNLGLYPESEPLVESALELRREHLGTDDLEVAEVADTLANIYWYQDKFDEAENLYKESLKIREAQVEPNDPRLAKSLNNLGLHYVVLGQYERAEPLYERSLAIREEVFGRDHSSMATALHNTAHLYTFVDRDEEALELFERSLRISRASRGEGSPHEVSTLMNIASVRLRLGRVEQAETAIGDALDVSRRVLGEDHYLTAAVLGVQAGIWSDSGRVEEAATQFEYAIERQERDHGPRHPYVGDTLEQYAKLLVKVSRWGDALSALERVRQIRRDTVGEGHALTERAERSFAEVVAQSEANSQ